MIVKVNVERDRNPCCPNDVFCFTDFVDILRADLLKKEDLSWVPFSIKQYKRNWWVNIPDEEDPLKVRVVDIGGADVWAEIVSNRLPVRPALRIDASQSRYIKRGDMFTFGGKRFYVVTDALAFCLSDIGDCAFSTHLIVSEAQFYGNSDIRQRIDKWFYDSIIEACKQEKTQLPHMKIDEIQLDMKIANEIQHARLNMTNENYADFLKTIINYATEELAETNKRSLTENCFCNMQRRCCCRNKYN